MRCFLPLLLATGLSIGAETVPALPTTWETAIEAALDRIEVNDQPFIIDRLLAPEFIKTLKEKHGDAGWKDAARKQVDRLPYFYSKLRKSGKAEAPQGDRFTVRGDYGMWAVFVKTPTGVLIGEVGQDVTTM